MVASRPTTFARTVLPSARPTVMSSSHSTLWWAATITPSADQTVPLRRASTRTTARPAFSTAAAAASERSMPIALISSSPSLVFCRRR